jgi:hypothetical protein
MLATMRSGSPCRLVVMEMHMMRTVSVSSQAPGKLSTPFRRLPNHAKAHVEDRYIHNKVW